MSVLLDIEYSRRYNLLEGEGISVLVADPLQAAGIDRISYEAFDLLLRQTLKQTLSQKIDPKIIMANNILACSTQELMQAVDQELADNPALERPDDDLCSACTLPKELCPDCPMKSNQEQSTEPDDPDWRDWFAQDTEIHIEFPSPDDPEFDPIANAVVQRSLRDHLIEQLRASTDKEQFHIGEFLIGYISESGYFEGDIEEASADLAIAPDKIEEVLKIIQGFDPTGVGARTLQECLLIQLQNMDEPSDVSRLALRMVRDYWSETAARKVTRLASLTKAGQPAVQQALDFIKDHLTPYPGESFRDPWANTHNSGLAVQPDVIIRRTVNGFDIEIVNSDYFGISLNPQYSAAYSKIRSGGAKNYSDEERKHIIEYVERAENFMRSIAQRRKTLKSITTYIVNHQQGYLDTGQKSFLRPLTRTQIGKALGIHESTVSRATANKFVKLPSDEVVSFDMFFDGSTSVKDLILDIIASENKSSPLSDQEIADILQERGLNVARRTVVKYREAQNILSSRQRRRAS